jgi:small GTP-binding protein
MPGSLRRGQVCVNGQDGKILLRDTAGQQQYDALNSASFTDVDVFIICFSLSTARETTLDNVEGKWMNILRKNNHLQNEAKVFLVGTQIDLPPAQLSTNSDTQVRMSASQATFIQPSAPFVWVPRVSHHKQVVFGGGSTICGLCACMYVVSGVCSTWVVVRVYTGCQGLPTDRRC